MHIRSNARGSLFRCGFTKHEQHAYPTNSFPMERAPDSVPAVRILHKYDGAQSRRR